jgi:hypothetical protein
MFSLSAIWGSLLPLALGAAAVAAAGWFGLPLLRWLAREAGVSLALARSIDGRHALALAWGLRRAARRLRRALAVVQDDPAQRHTLLLTLEHFTGDELTTLLRRMHVLIATGDNDRVRALNRQLSAQSAQWATLGEGPERQRLDAEMALLRQQMEESRRTSRAWVETIRALEQTGGALKALERDLALLGVARGSQLPDFRRRLDEISTHIQLVQQAHRELEMDR